MEVITGKGVLGQLGIDPLVVRFPLLAGFLFLLVGGLLGGYVVINNPPDTSKAPPNEGAGLPRDPLKTFDARNLDPLTTYTRGGVVNRPTGQAGYHTPSLSGNQFLKSLSFLLLVSQARLSLVPGVSLYFFGFWSAYDGLQRDVRHVLVEFVAVSECYIRCKCIYIFCAEGTGAICV
jgi:hypothetical protein